MFGQILQLATAFFLVMGLVFIHELGHYVVAKWMGIPVQRFRIGMGYPIFSKKWGTETWQIGCIPFGGFVEIHALHAFGEDKDGKEMERPPVWKRFFVLIAGVTVNIFFAFICFSMVWFFGGIERSFNEVNPFIGHIESNSAWDLSGLVAGDKILAINGKNVHSLSDALDSTIPTKKPILIDLVEADYKKGSFFKSHKIVNFYRNADGEVYHGNATPSSFIFYRGPISPKAPVALSELKKGDRIISANQKLLFSITTFEEVLRGESICVRIEKPNGSIGLISLDRVLVIDLLKKFDDINVLLDLTFDPEKGTDKKDCWWIPCIISDRLVVTKSLDCAVECGLSEGDRILEVQGISVSSPLECVRALQKRKLFLIVHREERSIMNDLIEESSSQVHFEAPFLKEGLYDLSQSSPGTSGKQGARDMLFLQPIEVAFLKDLFSDDFIAYEKSIWNAHSGSFYEEIYFDLMRKKGANYGIGGIFSDLNILWRKSPWTVFSQEFSKNMHFLRMFFKIKNVRILGPIGILKHVYHESAINSRRVLFLAGSLSLQFGMFNLLPIPIFDGGRIVFLMMEKCCGLKKWVKIEQEFFFISILLFWLFFIWYSFRELFSILS